MYKNLPSFLQLFVQFYYAFYGQISLKMGLYMYIIY